MTEYIVCYSFLILLYTLAVNSRPSVVSEGQQEITNFDSSDIPIYRLRNKNGSTCVLLKGDILVEISYRAPSGIKITDAYVPDDTHIFGACKSFANVATLILSWGEYSLRWKFFKSQYEDHWYIANLKLTFSTDIPSFHHIKDHAPEFTLIKKQPILKIPVKQSFTCEEHSNTLYPKDDVGKNVGLKAIIHIRQLQLQAFMETESSVFGPAFNCTNAIEVDYDDYENINYSLICGAIAFAILILYYICREIQTKNKRKLVEEKQLK